MTESKKARFSTSGTPATPPRARAVKVGAAGLKREKRRRGPARPRVGRLQERERPARFAPMDSRVGPKTAPELKQ
jgi:hypothetical protein